jgi:hypothetical protein
MNSEELVKEKSMPPTSIGKQGLDLNCWIGSFATGQPSSLVHYSLGAEARDAQLQFPSSS